MIAVPSKAVKNIRSISVPSVMLSTRDCCRGQNRRGAESTHMHTRGKMNASSPILLSYAGRATGDYPMSTQTFQGYKRKSSTFVESERPGCGRCP